MATSREPWAEKQVEQLLGKLMQSGVILAAAVVLVGSLVSGALWRHANRVPGFPW